MESFGNACLKISQRYVSVNSHQLGGLSSTTWILYIYNAVDHLKILAGYE